MNSPSLRVNSESFKQYSASLAKSFPFLQSSSISSYSISILFVADYLTESMVLVRQPPNSRVNPTLPPLRFGNAGYAERLGANDDVPRMTCEVIVCQRWYET